MKLSKLITIGAIVFSASTAAAQPALTTIMNPGTQFEVKVTCHSLTACFALGDSMARTDYANLVNECYERYSRGDEARLPQQGSVDDFYNCIANDEPDEK